MDLCIIMVLFYLFTLQGMELVKVTVEQGVLEGQVLKSCTAEENYYSFKGIPYARPPLRKLRFRAPCPPPKWKGVRNASEHGPICVQFTNETSETVIGSEDCLYLNVYSPNLNPKIPMAVMFFIHGGYFVIGSGNSDLYAGDFLIGYNIVLVTINYRLNALGFLSVDTEAASGNAGLMDQVAALKWVRKNIRHFGGDPKKVTIFGQSAGGVSVALHLLSPAAKGLFHRAIAMSGTVFNDWSITFEHKKRAFAVGRMLGLNTTDPNALIEFLQKVPAKKLVAIRPNIIISDELSRNFLTTFYFTPIIEKKINQIQQYLTKSPGDLLSRGQVNEVSFMAGHTQSEGLGTTNSLLNEILEYYPQFEQLYVPVKISNIRSPKEVLKIADCIRDHYITNKTISSSIRGYAQYYSYSHFDTEIQNFFDRYRKVNSNNQYLYIFSIYSLRNFYSQEAAQKFGIQMSTHRDDLPYLFDGSAYNMTVTVNSPVYKYIDIMCKLYTNFAKYGNPTPRGYPGFNWPSYDQNRSYVNISDTLEVGHVVNAGDLRFWNSIYDDAGVVPYMN